MNDRKIIEAVAAGLRKCEITPDAFLNFIDVSFIDRKELLGIPVFHTELFHQSYSDYSIPIIPIWKNEFSELSIWKIRFEKAFIEAYE